MTHQAKKRRPGAPTRGNRRAGAPVQSAPPWLWAALLFLLTWLVFSRCLTYPFINYDDPQYILEKPQITSGVTIGGISWSFTHAHGGNWHPLTSLSHMIDCSVFGLNASGHHAVSIALHALAVVLLFFVLLQVTGYAARSAFVAALFAIHPLRVESVAWIAERKDVLSGALFMLTLLAYLRYTRRRSSARYLTLLLSFSLGLMAKPMLVSTPFVLLILDCWRDRGVPAQEFASNAAGAAKCDRLSWRSRIREKIPLFVLAGGSCVATMLAQHGAISSLEAIPLSQRLLNAAQSYFTYVREMLWPAKLALFYPLNNDGVTAAGAIVAIMVLSAITVAVVRLRKRHPSLLAGWLWYVVMLLPVIGIVQVGLQSHADRYTYLPQIGLYIALTWLVAETFHRLNAPRMILPVVSGLTVVVLCLCTWNQLGYWRDSETVWRRTLSVTSRNHLAHSYLADLLLRQDRFAESIAESEQALAITETDSDAHNNLAMALFRTGRLADAVPHWKRSLEIAPHALNAQANYGWILSTSPDASLRDGPRAVTLLEDVVAQAGRDNPMVLRGLGAAYAASGRFSDAIATAREAMALAAAQQNQALVQDLELNIRTYQDRRPLRDPGISPTQ